MDSHAFETGLSIKTPQQINKTAFYAAKAKAHALPQESGVYLMKDENNTVIYVGKAKNLRNRVSQYFLPNRDRKTRALVEKIRDINFIITGNDYEALILENNLIKKYSPHYNILLKDGKSYPVIKITKEDFPKIYKTRRIIKDGSEYFGPYPNSGAVDTYLDIINKIYPLRRCASPLKKQKNPCLYHHIGLCPAPCCGKADMKTYNRNINNIKKMLKGDFDSLENELTKTMTEYSQSLNFEKAAQIRDILTAVKNMQKTQTVEIASSSESCDYATIQSRRELCTVSIMQFRDGKLIGKALYRAVSVSEENETLASFLMQYYENAEEIPKEIYISHETDSELLKKYFAEQLHCNVQIKVPKDGKHFRILNLAKENAAHDVEKRLKAIDNTPALESLQKTLSLEKIPSLIEGFDIAQLNGKYTVASLISFKDGNPNPHEYRRFNIKSLNGEIDDFQAIREAVFRRYSRVVNENLPRPDLILIDGGHGQVNTARDVLDQIGLADVPVVGLAKKKETIVFDNNRPDLNLDLSDEGLRILIAVRDECHRFATGANQAMRSKEASFRLLESVKGVGKTTSAKIMNSYSSIDEILILSARELANGAKIPVPVAERILEKLKI